MAHGHACTLRAARAALILVWALMAAAGCGGGGSGGGSGGEEESRSGTLSVRVVNQWGGPVTGAAVRTEPGPSEAVMTDSSGAAVVSGLPRGTVSVRVSADRHTSLATTATVQSSKPRSGGGHPAQFEVRLERETALVRVSATDSRGQPVAGVDLWGIGSGSRAWTDAAGHAELQLPTGPTELRVRAGYYDYFEGTWRLTVSSTGNPTVSLVIDPMPVASVLTARLERRSAGEGLVLDAELLLLDGDGLPIQTLTSADVRLISCIDPLGGCTSVGLLDDLGAYRTWPVERDPLSVTLLPAKARSAYAATMLIDQSTSAARLDPLDRRLAGARQFLDGLSADSFAALAGYPGQPGPSALQWFGDFSSDVQSHLAAIDAMASSEGGTESMLTALEAAVEVTAASAPGASPLLRRSVVVWPIANDSCPTLPDCRADLERVINRALASEVAIVAFRHSVGFVQDALLAELANRTGGALLHKGSQPSTQTLAAGLDAVLSRSLPTYRLQMMLHDDATTRPPGPLTARFDLRLAVPVREGVWYLQTPFYAKLP